MIELISTVAIAIISAVLFCYWFHYSCLVILSAKATREYANAFASSNLLAFPHLKTRLAKEDPLPNELLDSLNRDYALLRYVLRSPSRSEVRLLAVHYQLTGYWFKLALPFSTRIAHQALSHMYEVVVHLADLAGEQSTLSAA